MDWLQSIFTGIPPFFLQLIISAGIGLIIGLEREFNTHEDPSHIGGIRTFTLVAVLGTVSGWISEHTHFSVLVALVACFTLLVGLVYYVQTQHGKIGLTTEAALLLTFLLGIANAKGLVQESIAVVVLMTTILSLKARLHQFVRQITEDELFAFLKFIILALLILPMLPTTAFGPHGLLNARDLGYIAVLVLSLSFAGYLLLKFGSPHKGILWTAVIGGLFSSTMIAWVFSAKSKDRKDLASAYGAGIVLASSIMFVRVFVWLSIFSFDVAKYMLLPLLVMLLVSLIPTWQVIKLHQKSGEAPALSPGNPLDIKNAVFFVLLYVGITLAMAASREWLSQALIYVSGAVAGIADIDAITISTSKWAATPEGNTREAAIIVLLAVMSNSIFKWLVSVINGPKELRKPVGIGFSAVLAVGLICMIYWLV
ncbi:MAG: MgtC/SapB family protein [Chitinophagales bacterium]|nr:MgtC/SapB family protein [Chitinophagales bacterium]